ncbi:DUF551 domain-containing protein [Escherichia sp. MOD1-EC5949]|uniref:DUF551 domain-containing protein n=1 Tax=Escherichia sp. MOD1-EC5949 TaxID=2093878 RepID=UPI000CF769CF|nr:DUF551 domain-containing protein [Escherichia sp. MOD1-EC5949]
MTTITRENAEIKSFIAGFLSDPAHDNQSTDSLLANVFRIAQASLEAEPVAYIFKHPAGKLFWALTDESNKEQADVIPVYAAAPASVVPDNASEPLAYAYKELTPEIMRNHLAVFERYGIAPNDSSTTIQALRIALDGNHTEQNLDMVDHFGDATKKAMLHGAEPVSQTYKLNELSGNSPVTPDGWISCSERMPDDGQWCVVNTEYGYYVQCWSEGQGWLGDDISIPECDVINWMPLPEPPQEVNRG